MRLVVRVGRVDLAPVAEVRIMADGALPAQAPNVPALSRQVLAQRTVTKDGRVQWAVTSRRHLERLVDGHKAMALVQLVHVGVARGAEVPVRTRQALVADAIDVLEYRIRILLCT